MVVVVVVVVVAVAAVVVVGGGGGVIGCYHPQSSVLGKIANHRSTSVNLLVNPH